MVWDGMGARAIRSPYPVGFTWPRCHTAEAGMAADPDNFTPGSTNEQLVRSSIDEARCVDGLAAWP